MSAPVLELDGHSLTVEDVARVARDPRARVAVAAEALERVRRGREHVWEIVESYRAAYDSPERRPVQDYGVTTGFGEFKDIPVSPEDLEKAQRNLLLSHAAGVGSNELAADPSNYFSAEAVRATLAIRLNTFLRGHSGVRVEMVETVRAMLERGIVPLVPTRGSLGSSGDLCPLAHLFAVLVGAGSYYRVERAEDLWAPSRERELRAATEHLEADLGAPPTAPSFKESLALINGATFSTALLALAVDAVATLLAAADVAAALTLEAVCGCARAFDPAVHEARGHPGQISSARNVRRLVEGSRLVDSAFAVQDVYSLRCAPVVHGASRDALAHARAVIERELNAATDNPLFFPEAHENGEPWDFRFRENWPPGYDGEARRSYSAGNFHGQPIALAADFLTIAVAEVADVSERRTQMLLDKHHNRNLPANLVARRGLQSGYMLAQYSAASLVSENKVLAHPASVDSIPTAANSEDHVAMATTAARKLGDVVANAQAVVGIELLVAAQAVDWRAGMGYPPIAGNSFLGPEKPARGAEGPARVDEEARLFAERTAPGERDRIASRLGTGTAAAYRAVRAVAEPLVEDRVLADEIRRARAQVASGEIVERVAEAVGAPLRPSADG